jgi:tRNA threonylcarbamoyladenosine biosynthesis protein TsaB
MAVILSIETSTSVCSAALHENGNLIACKELFTPHSAASQLAVQIQELLQETEIEIHQLAAVAVCSGPGSYTGLRIGTSTAKGICYGLNLPLIAVDSLWALASNVKDTAVTDLLCPMIDARRMEVYCCLLDASFRSFAETHARVIDADSFNEILSHHFVLFFGDGAAKCREIIRHPHAAFADQVYNSAGGMGRLAWQKFVKGEFEDLRLFEPKYLKEFVAKTKLA